MRTKATRYRDARVIQHMIDGLPQHEAEAKADQELEQWKEANNWDNPLPIPETPEEQWWE